MHTTSFFAPLRKIEDSDDGSIMVTGVASTETRDSSGEVILASAIKKALPAYKRYPAIREMHRSTSAAGRAVEISVDDDGVTHLTAHIVDSDAVKKVKTKTYGGFSVGGKVVKRDPKDKSVITEIILAEISLVDRPAHPEAAITMWKVDGDIGNDVEKRMSHVHRFAALLKGLSSLAASAQSESELDGEESPLPEQLRNWLKSGSAIFREMARSEVDKFSATFEEAESGIAKAVLRERDPLDAANAALAKLERALQPDAADTIMRAFRARDHEIDRLQKRVDELLAEPLPAKTAGSYGVFSVDKEDDAGGAPNVSKSAPSQDDLVAVLQAMPEDDRAMLLTKAALQLPRQVVSR